MARLFGATNYNKKYTLEIFTDNQWQIYPEKFASLKEIATHLGISYFDVSNFKLGKSRKLEDKYKIYK